MSFPNFKNKYGQKPVFTAKDYLKYLENTNRLPGFKPPEGIIFCYSRRFIEQVLRKHKIADAAGFGGRIYLLEESGRRIGVALSGIGAPAVITRMEEYIAFGVKKFISIGTAGSLQKDLDIGSLVICEEAIRDEGVSHHYLPPSKYAYASKDLTKKIINAVKSAGLKYTCGPNWTIDVPYMETKAEIKKYQREGVLTVDMEAASIFAAAQRRDVQAGAVFMVSDSLADLKWNPQFHSVKLNAGFETVFNSCVSALSVNTRQNADPFFPSKALRMGQSKLTAFMDGLGR